MYRTKKQAARLKPMRSYVSNHITETYESNREKKHSIFGKSFDERLSLQIDLTQKYNFMSKE